MAQNFAILGNGRKLSTDRVSKSIGGNTHEVDRQHVVVVQPEDASQVGYPAAQLADVPLLNGGSANLGVNGSVTPQLFEHVVAADDELLVDQVALVIRDDGTTFSIDKFGGLSTLANGLLLQVLDASDVVKSNLLVDTVRDFGELLRVADEYTAPFAASARIVLRCARGGAPMYLPAGYKLRATVRDDLSGLTSFTITARCRKV